MLQVTRNWFATLSYLDSSNSLVALMSRLLVASGFVGPQVRLVLSLAATRGGPTFRLFSLDQLGFFSLSGFALLPVNLPVKIDLPFDQGHFRDGVDREGMLAEDYEIRVLADVDGSGPLADSKLNGRIQCRCSQRLFLAEPPILHCLCGIKVQPPGALVRIRIDCHHHAPLGHQRSVVWNRIIGFQLVGPEVRKGGTAGLMGSYLIGNLVTLEDMLESLYMESQLIAEAEEHQDLIVAVTVRVHHPLSIEYLDQGV